MLTKTTTAGSCTTGSPRWRGSGIRLVGRRNVLPPWAAPRRRAGCVQVLPAAEGRYRTPQRREGAPSWGSFSRPAATKMHVLGFSTSAGPIRTLFRPPGSSGGSSKSRMSSARMSPSSFPSGASWRLLCVLMAGQRSGSVCAASLRQTFF